MNLTFIELPLFTKQLFEVANDEVYRAFQNELLVNPDKGDIIPHSGGLSKVRMRLEGRGKRGGARVIYLYLRHHQVIVFFYLYTKAQSENLNQSQLRRLHEAVNEIKKEFRP